MPHAPYDHIAKRNLEVIAEYQRDPSTPRAVLARRFGLSLIALDRLLRMELGVERAPRRRAAVHELRPVSNLHRCLGVELETRLQASRKGKLTDYAYASRAGSPQRVAGLLAGIYDITLGELQALAAYLGVTPAEIFAAAAERESRICKPQTLDKVTG